MLHKLDLYPVVLVGWGVSHRSRWARCPDPSRPAASAKNRRCWWRRPDHPVRGSQTPGAGFGAGTVPGAPPPPSRIRPSGGSLHPFTVESRRAVFRPRTGEGARPTA